MPRSSTLRAAAVTVAVALALPALAGCAEVPEYPVLATAAAAELPSASFATRAIEVTLRSEVDHPVVVTGGTVYSPYFERLDAEGLDVTLPAGGEATVKLPLGVVTCPAGEGPSSVQVVIEGDGVELLQSVMLRDREIEELNTRACELVEPLLAD